MSEALLRVEGLVKYFPIKGGLLRKTTGLVRAVDGVSFHINRGETLGLVGESGCGKTTVGRAILRLTEPTDGRIYFEGIDITKLSKEELRRLRHNMQMVFQDPYSSLNPRMTVKNIVGEPMLVNKLVTKNEDAVKVLKLLQVVGLNPDHMNRYPHEFSGGQRQRIGIARALALDPKLIVCDEPTSALDVSVQAQVLNLLKDLQNEYGFAYLFISHDLSVIKHMSGRVAVMYLGKIAEICGCRRLFEQPRHPYTQALFSAILEPDPDIRRQRIILRGDVPSPVNPPLGCRFHPRCRAAEALCKISEPTMVKVEREHLVACHLAKAHS